MEQSIVVNSESFSNSITLFEAKVKRTEEILKKITDIMKEIDGENETWKCGTAKKVHEAYCDTEKEFENINKMLKEYETFLKDVLESYNKEEQKIEKAIENSEDNLNINE